MTQITPTLKKVNPPSLPSNFDELRLDIQKSINCVRPGIIKAYNPGDATHAPTATVQIAQQQVTSISPTGVKTLQPYPDMPIVPVVFPHGGGFTLTFPVQVGDECLLFFNDRELDNWLEQGANQAPTTPRIHDLSDAFALVGIRSNPNALAGVSTDSVQLRSDNYTGPTGVGECIDVSAGKIQLNADEINIHARTKLTYDVDGVGVVWTPSLITSYTIGVATASEPPNPPEVPT